MDRLAGTPLGSHDPEPEAPPSFFKRALRIPRLHDIAVENLSPATLKPIFKNFAFKKVFVVCKVF